jgi:hypothetical protein
MALSDVKDKLKLVAANWDERLDTSAEGMYRVDTARAQSQGERDWAAAIAQAEQEEAAAPSPANVDRLRARLLARMTQLEATRDAAFTQAERRSKAAWDKTDQSVYGKQRKERDWVGAVKGLEAIKTLTRLAKSTVAATVRGSPPVRSGPSTP